MLVLFQALWVDADQEGAKAAEGAGMKALLVENLHVALEKLADFTGVQVHSINETQESVQR